MIGAAAIGAAVIERRSAMAQKHRSTSYLVLYLRDGELVAYDWTDEESGGLLKAEENSANWSDGPSYIMAIAHAGKSVEITQL